MTPLSLFEAVWARCDHLTLIHGYLAKNVAGAMPLDELLRAEWVTRVSALDLYVHELIAQRMLSIFEGARKPTPAYVRFKIPNETLHRVRSAPDVTSATAAFDLEVRQQLSLLTFQDPEKIADGIRLVSDCELWNEVVFKLGATEATKHAEAKKVRQELSLIVQRRNKIAHEGDLQPTPPREPWPISRVDVNTVAQLLERVVRAIDVIVPP